MRFFSSAFAVYTENTASYDDKAKYALTFYLQKLIPKGGILEVVNPKSVLCSILPNIAKSRGARVVLIQATSEARIAFADVIANKAGVSDLVLAEPDAFVPGGALVNPSESKAFEGKSVVGVGSVLQITGKNPASHDFVELQKRVTENGIESLSFL